VIALESARPRRQSPLGKSLADSIPADIVNRMVNRLASLDALFQALSDPTRRAMVLHLSRGPATIGELGHPFDMTKPAVTKHVRVLERAGLLKRAVDGRIHHCAIDPRALDSAQAWMDKVRTKAPRPDRSRGAPAR
jgi:DNA-binding transcriptional ArsR family regulator